MRLIHEKLQSMLGSPDENLTFAGRLGEMFTALADTVPEPDSAVARMSAITAMQAFGDEVSRLSKDIQSLRQDADRRIGEAVDTVNAALVRIHDLNPLIARRLNAGQEATALEEQRTQAINEIAQFLDLRIFTRSNNFISLSTSTGVVLDDSVGRKLVYTPAGTISTNTGFEPISVRKIDPGTGVVSTTGVALDPNLVAGSLRGLIDMRSRDLPDLALELGEFAARVADEFNKVHNDSTAVPPPAKLDGRATGLLATDQHGFTGQVTFAVTNSSQLLAKRIDVDFSAGTITTDGGAPAALSGTTLGDIVNDVNGALGFTSFFLAYPVNAHDRYM